MPRYTNSTLRSAFHAITLVRECPLNLGKIKGGEKKDSHRVIISILLEIYSHLLSPPPVLPVIVAVYLSEARESCKIIVARILLRLEYQLFRVE